MASAQDRHLGVVFALAFATCGLVGCGSGDSGGSASSGGTSGGGSSHSSAPSSSGGSSASPVSSSKEGGTGGNKGSGGQQAGSTASKGGDPVGGKSATSTETAGGGSSASSVSQAGSTAASTAGGGGTGGTRTGGTSAAGGTATGGKASGGAGGGTTGAGGTNASGGSTSTASGDCKKGQVKASEVVFMGESFYAIAPQYNQKRVESNAKKAGALGANESYRNVAISGQPLSVIVGEFDTALQGGAVKVVIMDGGGIDCMSSPCDACPDLFKNLLTKMASKGVQEVIYTRYPEPGNPPGSNATLKKNLDTLMPKMQPLCEGATGLKCHWVDLRPVWVNGDTSDGLHPTQSGGDHVGDLIWAEMVKDCIAQ